MKYLSEESIARYLPYFFAFFSSILLIRVYEIATLWFIHPSVILEFSYYLRGFFLDFILGGFYGFFFGVFFLLIEKISRPFAEYLIGLLMIVFLFIYSLLIRYFLELLMPLGSDLYAYNLVEIHDTVSTTVNIRFTEFIPALIFLTFFGLLVYLFKKIPIKEKSLRFTFSFILFATLFTPLVYPGPNNYVDELNYYLVTNKSAYFFSESIQHVLNFHEVDRFDGKEYPLLRDFEEFSVLKDEFEVAEHPPNFVFIVIESFGGSFMKPHAPYGGFTPFLDSLAEKSLYFTHFLANSGRSFGLHPSLFGSLPFGERGFMDMKTNSPTHLTLIQILNNNGYHTGYYCGYDTRFDNIGLFLDQQGIDFIMDSHSFTDDYKKMDVIDGGFTWGYEDKATFRRAFDFIQRADQQAPRLDIFFTVNLHEPFIISEQEVYLDEVKEVVNTGTFSNRRRQTILNSENIFASILYTDDSIKELINRYQKRDDYEHTIFVITGDHRLAPIPHETRLDRYYVPFLIYSPLLKNPRRIDAVSSHLNVAPSFSALLNHQYDLKMPDNVHWLAGQIDLHEEFRSVHKIPFMRNKNQMNDYLYRDKYLSQGQVFQLKKGMLLAPIAEEEILDETEDAFQQFRSLNRYVTQQNKLMPPNKEQEQQQRAIEKERLFIRQNNLENFNPDEKFEYARELAFSGNYTDSRIVLSHLLRAYPSFHDARLLYGRTFGWNGEYQLAEEQFREVLRRNPDYSDTYSALSDLYFWQGEQDSSLTYAESGLENNPGNSELMFRRARAYWLKQDLSNAEKQLKEILMSDPNHEAANELLNRITSAE